LAEGRVDYGATTNYGKTVYTPSPRSFSQTVTLNNLTPGTLYYFRIIAKDIFGRQTEVGSYSFRTKGGSTDVIDDQSYGSGGGQVLGIKTFNVDLKTDFGFYGLYYNLPASHPDVETGVKPWTKTPFQTDWYDPKYFAFDRVDAALNFGAQFFPVNQNQPGDPYYFAVNWRAIIEVPQDDYYTFDLTSDDDSWIYIDGNLASDLGGIHAEKTDSKKIALLQGYHKIEIYYAERMKSGAAFFLKTDPRLKFHPLPQDQEVQDVINYNKTLGQNTSGRVLGAKVTQSSTIKSALVYPCNPNLGYTKIKALYRTKASPDVWAILENGLRHYITSPASLAKYECDSTRIKIVSQSVLNKYPITTLVRTPQDPAIYHLYQRPENKWLKINLASPTVFISYPNNYWGNVAWINGLDLAAYPDVQLIKIKDQSNIYLLENNFKRLIGSIEIFNRLNYHWYEVVQVNQIHLDSYQTGSIVE
jgi:fibro-slime domain-containing protein